MNIIYFLSAIYLIVLFLMHKKNNKKLCLISSIIYTILLFFCYNTAILYLLFLLKIKGSLLLFSIINYTLGSILGISILKNKKTLQKYNVDKKKIVIFLILGIIIFLVGYFRFRGFNAIAFESSDSAIHYRHALRFKEELSILHETNSQDIGYGNFARVMPLSYINCGLLLNIFTNIKPHTLFLIYNVLCLMLGAFVFLITIIDIFKYKKKDYIYALILTIFYTLAFPLNSFLFGFCYLGLCIAIINLLYLTLFHFEEEYNKKISLKLIIIFLMTFSIFFSYYLFVPAIYLALGLYYIHLYKTKKINFKQTILYGIITLIIPFILGFNHFLIPQMINKGVGVIGSVINTWGYTYDNITPIYLFFISAVYILYNILFSKKEKNNYLNINLYITAVYIVIFFVLYILRQADVYYFYKLFYLYWLLLLIFIANKISKYRKIFYIGLIIFAIINIFVYNFPTSKLTSFLIKTNIYTYNTNLYDESKLVYTKEETKLMEKSMEYQDVCNNNGKFLVLGDVLKNIWFYSVTSNNPITGELNGDIYVVFHNKLQNFKAFEYNEIFDCLVYYYENEEVNIDEEKYNILYQNKDGAIIKRIKR